LFVCFQKDAVFTEVNSVLADLSDYNALEAYYSKRPDLEDLTIETDLARMRYVVLGDLPSRSSVCVTTPDEIRQIYFHWKNAQSPALTPPNTTDKSSLSHVQGGIANSGFVWRISNQTILAELASVLHSTMVAPYMDLNLSVRNVSTVFHLDLHNDSVQVIPNFEIGKLTDHRFFEMHKFVLGCATVIVACCFCVSLSMMACTGDSCR
jgi:hypothetical protein